MMLIEKKITLIQIKTKRNPLKVWVKHFGLEEKKLNQINPFFGLLAEA